jgi:hypothetical protein
MIASAYVSNMYIKEILRVCSVHLTCAFGRRNFKLHAKIHCQVFIQISSEVLNVYSDKL